MLSKLKLRPYFFVFFLDIVLIAVTFISSTLYHNRNLALKKFVDPNLLVKACIHTGLAILLWLVFKINKRIIKHYRAIDFIRLITVISLLHLISFGIDYLFTVNSLKFGIVVFVESFFVSTVALIVIRYSVSFLYEKFISFHNQAPLKKILIYGAGERGTILKKSIESSINKKYLVVGYIDDDKNKISRYLLGTKIYSKQEAISKLISQQKVSNIIIATNKISIKDKSDFIEKVLPFKVKVRQIDSFTNWYDTEFNFSKLATININDLMGRDSVAINNDLIISSLQNKVAFVTGAAGSIGSELVRKLVENNAETIICIDFSESALYDLQQELIKKNTTTVIHYVLADIRDKTYLEFLFKKYLPNVVFHAAAYKHVPMMEEFPWQSINTNVLGTWNVAKLSIDCEVEKFILISTDKAVNPQSIMGTTKRLAEILIRSLSTDYIHTKFIITRFGNVLDSNGSVVPLFKKQILQGGPITVTHPDMERFFMTIPEACHLVLEAFAMGNGGEIFVFDMGKPIKIKDLAANMIRLAGYVPNVDINIIYTGVRKGEKLSEEMFSNRETFLPTHHDKIFISSEATFYSKVANRIISKLTQNLSYNSFNYQILLNEVLADAEKLNVENEILEAV
jgi:nucleoside-diphosphate-sugar epimerase